MSRRTGKNSWFFYRKRGGQGFWGSGAGVSEAGVSGRESWGRIFTRMARDRTAASRAVPAKLSQMPVSPKGHRAAMSTTGNTRAVATEMREAGRGFYTASI